MKKLKKIILGASVFSAAMNLNGCVYGPPPDEDVINSLPDSVSVTEYEPPEQNTDSEELQSEN